MTLSSGRQAALLWLAFGLMVVDHVGMLLLPEWWGLRLIGRGAFPLFAGLIAYNLAVREVPARRYLSRLAVFAAVSQVPYALVAGPYTLNIFVTLGLGVMVWAVGTRSLSAWWLLLLPVGLYVDYGLAGVALIPAGAVALRWKQERRMWAGIFVLLTGAAQWNAVWALAAMAWVGVLLLLTRSGRLPALRRSPRWFGYGFYPAHLVLLLGLRLIFLS